MIKKGWRTGFKIVTNKFLVTGVAFIAWIAYFDTNDWVSQRERRDELKGIKDNIAYLTDEISKMEKERTALLSDPQKLEQFARENFRMKRDNEDLYVIEK